MKISDKNFTGDAIKSAISNTELQIGMDYKVLDFTITELNDTGLINSHKRCIYTEEASNVLRYIAIQARGNLYSATIEERRLTQEQCADFYSVAKDTVKVYSKIAEYLNETEVGSQTSFQETLSLKQLLKLATEQRKIKKISKSNQPEDVKKAEEIREKEIKAKLASEQKRLAAYRKKEEEAKRKEAASIVEAEIDIKFTEEQEMYIEMLYTDLNNRRIAELAVKKARSSARNSLEDVKSRLSEEEFAFLETKLLADGFKKEIK